MNVKRIMEELLAETGIPFAYGDLADPVTPYIAWTVGDSEITAPDGFGGLTARADTVTVELYTTGKDWALEDRLEALIERYGPRRHEERNYYEGAYQITYVFTINSKNRRTQDV